MQHPFSPNDFVHVKKDIVLIKKHLGSGLQGDVYQVINIGHNKEMAMKHMYGFFSTNPRLFFNKVTILSKYPAPHSDMIWPLLVGDFETNTKSFVYLMDLLPSDFTPISYVIKHYNSFSNAQRLSISKKLAEIFSTLHEKNFIYGDISANNIFYRFDKFGNADIRIIDCENVTLERHSMGLSGTGLFRSPEVLLGEAPTIKSDAHALSVVIFRMMIGSHPLDGKYTWSVPVTSGNIIYNFATNPQYIFSKNSSNGPKYDIYNERYRNLSPSLRRYFDIMFSSNCLHNSRNRPDLTMLLSILNKMDERRILF